MKSRGLYGYNFYLACQRSWWLPPLIIGIYIAQAWHGGKETWDWRPLFEVFLPLLTLAYIVPVMVDEKQGGTWPLILSYPMGRLRLFAAKILPALAMAMLLILATWGALQVLGLPVSGRALGIAMPGFLFLSGLAVTSGVLSSTPMVSWFLPVGWWALDFSTRGRFTGSWYLFSLSYPEEGIEVIPTKVTLALTGIFLWILAALIFRQIRRE